MRQAEKFLSLVALIRNVVIQRISASVWAVHGLSHRISDSQGRELETNL